MLCTGRLRIFLVDDQPLARQSVVASLASARYAAVGCVPRRREAAATGAGPLSSRRFPRVHWRGVAALQERSRGTLGEVLSHVRAGEWRSQGECIIQCGTQHAVTHFPMPLDVIK